MQNVSASPTTDRSNPEGGPAALLGVGVAKAAAARPSTIVRSFPAGEPWMRPTAEWDALEPTGIYARAFRTPLLYALALVAAVPALAIAAPIALVNALIHRGLRRIFFLQERVGLRGRTYVMVKFRTMRDDAEVDDVRRVTRFGKLLRNSHLDELPQVWNVLRGDMALIGPRPEMLEIERWAAEAVPHFAERLVLRPGITGYAQITQGYAENGDVEAYATKAEINREYRSRVTLRGDLAILVGTVLWMLRLKGWSNYASAKS